MKSIKYLSGDATIPFETDSAATVICHCCNAFGGWGRGFVVPLGMRFPKAKNDYVEFCTPYQESNDKRNELMGKVCLSKVGNKVFVANIIGQYFYSKNQRGIKDQVGVDSRFLPIDGRFVSYDSIRMGFRELVFLMNGIDFIVQMPKMGCGLAGGNWEIIEEIIVEELCVNNIQVNVYELE